jgi:hypothetical protein
MEKTRAHDCSWGCVGLLIGVVAYIGCSNDATNSLAPVGGNGRPVVSAHTLLDEIAPPELALVVTGQLDGFLEPCGCSKGQAGGLVRRYEFFERLRAKGWPIAAVDLGGLIGEGAIAKGGIEQARIKQQYILKAFALLKYDALVLDGGDLRIGVKEALGIYRDDLGTKTKLVISNIRASAPFEGLFTPGIVADLGSVKLGITSVVEPALLANLDDPDKAKLLPTIESAGDVLPRILADLESKTDYQALLVQGPFEVAERLAVSNPGFDVVIAASDAVGALDRRPRIMNNGKTRLVTVGRRGYNVGMFAFYRDRLPIYKLVALNDLYDGPGAKMKALIQDGYRGALKAAGVVEKFPKEPAFGSEGDVYIGAETCGKCHANTFKKWSTTKHARAFASLLHVSKPNTAFDAECVTCHVTGFRHESGWRSEAITPYLAGNQCENCHGAGSRHAADPAHVGIRQSMRFRSEHARRALCVRCHDHDNSPDFDVTRYWSQIVHNGL